MTAADSVLASYRELVERYHGTLDLISPQGLVEFDRFIDEGRRYAALSERLAGPAPRIVDVGSGVGLPGVVLAACLPRATVHLVERRRRRAAFLDMAVARLGLANARVFAGDVRDLRGVVADVVTAQAVARLAELVKLTAAVRAEPCWLLTRRGTNWKGELAAALQAAGAADGASGTGAENLSAEAQVAEEPLGARGSLVAIRLPGGSACRSSA